MCGIVGIHGPAGELPADQAFAAACLTLAHRGPDDQGLFRDAQVLLGHRRLSIIDLNSGHQPVRNEGGTVWTIFNGEIYNYVELRAELSAIGHSFYTQSDTEVIVHAYEQWGVDGFARLRGMFAIALWDAARKTLVLARDPLGKKPLYYTAQGRLRAFASELKALQRLPGLEFTVDPEALRDFALFGYVPTPRSIFKQVSKVQPGHCVIIAGDTVEERCFWRLGFEPKHTGSTGQLLAELDQHLNDAVRLRLRSDVPFGAFLSGGLDSSMVVALMARHLDRPVKTFSIGFEEDRFNELADARLIAEHIRSEHHELVVRPDAVALLDRLVWHFDEPFADSSAIPTFLVAQQAAQEVKMVLSGDGGDEAFGGYQRYLKQQVVERARRWSGGLAGPLLQAAGGLLPTGLGRRVAWLGRRISLPFPARYLSSVALNPPNFVNQWLAAQPDRLDYGAVEQGFSHRYRDLNDRMLHGDIGSYLLDDILVKVDRMTMANSIEARAPLLDAELIQFAARLPTRLKMRHGEGKYLFRKLAQSYLPTAALHKRKQGFAIPLAQWFKGELRPLISDTLRDQKFKESGFFDQTVAQRLLDQHLAGTADRSEQLWQMLVLALWHARSTGSELPIAMAAEA